MKLHLILFSPTGTSRKIAKAIAGGSGLETVVCDVTHTPNKSLTIPSEDIALIAAPVYGGHMASKARERMSAIRGRDTKCILVAVYGNRAFESALTDMDTFASSLGFMPVAAAAFVGEHSYSTADYPIAAGRPDSADLSEAERFGHEIAHAMASGRLHRIETASLTDIPSPEESLAAFGRFVTDYRQRQSISPQRLIPETDLALCSSCGACAVACPTGAIPPDGKTTDPQQCIKCCACVKACPAGARTLASPFAPVLSANFSKRKPAVLSL